MAQRPTSPKPGKAKALRRSGPPRRVQRATAAKLRPDDPIQIRQIGRLATIGSTLGQAAAVLGVSREDFCRYLSRNPRIRERWHAGSLTGQASLKRAQFRSALKGNVKMLIWLGKRYLGQCNNPARGRKGRTLGVRSSDFVPTGPGLNQTGEDRVGEVDGQKARLKTAADPATRRAGRCRAPARPRKLRPDDREQIRQIRELASFRCTQAEAAAVLDVTREEFNRHLARHPAIREEWDAGLLEGLVMLRQAQFKLAIAGNGIMQIWLGKNCLGQSETPAPETNGRHCGLYPDGLDALVREPDRGRMDKEDDPEAHQTEAAPHPVHGPRSGIELPELCVDETLVRRIRELAALQCVAAEVAAMLGISQAEFRRLLSRSATIRDALDRGVLQGRVSLRRAQFRAAEAGNVLMLVWLGKNCLDQRNCPAAPTAKLSADCVPSKSFVAMTKALDQVAAARARTVYPEARRLGPALGGRHTAIAAGTSSG